MERVKTGERLVKGLRREPFPGILYRHDPSPPPVYGELLNPLPRVLLVILEGQKENIYPDFCSSRRPCAVPTGTTPFATLHDCILVERTVNGMERAI